MGASLRHLNEQQRLLPLRVTGFIALIGCRFIRLRREALWSVHSDIENEPRGSRQIHTHLLMGLLSVGPPLNTAACRSEVHE